MHHRIVLVALAAMIGLSGCAAVLFGGVATGVYLAHDRRSTGAIMDDQAIEIWARRTLDEDQELEGPANLNVMSHNGWVLLTGQVPNAQTRDRAEYLVRTDARVREVFNELAIGPPSTFDTHSQDALITSQVKSSLFTIQMKDFDPSRVRVTTEQGVTYLMGLVTPAEADAATEVARQVGGVERVVRIFELVELVPAQPAAGPEDTPRSEEADGPPP
jgi:osmotically-inducible protein OsmY